MVSQQTLVRTRGREIPNVMLVRVPRMSADATAPLAEAAVATARSLAPKSSGAGAQGLSPYYGRGFFGIRWDRDYMWFQEQGIRGFTMRNLAGKTIPMWIDDPDGSEAAKIPVGDRARRTRITASGKRQVLIFRRAARMGQRKRKAVHHRNGTITYRSVPASYPGAPGRIARRHTINGRSTGKIAKISPPAIPHKGVRWHFPGLVGRHFMAQALTSTAAQVGLGSRRVEAVRVEA